MKYYYTIPWYYIKRLSYIGYEEAELFEIMKYSRKLTCLERLDWKIDKLYQPW